MLPPLEAESPDEEYALFVVLTDGEYYVTLDHPMKKDHYITCIAAVSDNACQFTKLYPEDSAEARFRPDRVRLIYAFCNRHGLFRTETKGVGK